MSVVRWMLGTIAVFAIACGGAAGGNGGAQAGTVSGIVVNSAGKPLAGAKLRIRGAGLSSGDKLAFDTTSGSDGTYRLAVPDGLFTVSGEYAIDFDNQHFTLPLDPDGGKPDDKPSKDGLVQNFTWKLSGLLPNASQGSTSPYDYYGGAVDTQIADVYNESFQTNHFAEEFPNGFTAEVTFTPAGPLADGSTGKVITSTKQVKTMYDAEWKIFDLPLGRYTVTAVAKKPDGTTHTLKIAAIKKYGIGGNDPPQDSATLDFAAEAVLGLSTMGMRLAYGPPYPPLD